MISTAEVGGPLSKSSLAELAYEKILEAIIGGKLSAGTELAEVALADQLAISRTPVHEALRRLARDGLVEQAPNRKARVAGFNPDDIRDLYDLRTCLEASAAERAAIHITTDRLKSLRREADALGRERESPRWTSLAIDFDGRFHDAIAEASGNRRLRDEVRRCRLLVRGFCRITGTPENLWEAYQEHLRILEALEARDASRTRKAMERHISIRVGRLLGKLNREAVLPPSAKEPSAVKGELS